MLNWFKGSSTSAARLALDLQIEGCQTFTSFERCAGKLKIKAMNDVEFDSLEITLTGISRTNGRRVVPQAPNARTVTTTHRFLELRQPNLAFDFPDQKVFKAHRTYDFEFEFTIPEHMISAVCRHRVASSQVHQLHTSMPPSFGDHGLGSMTDYAPCQTSIKYSVTATIQERVGSGQLCETSSCSRNIRFMPSGDGKAAGLEKFVPADFSAELNMTRRIWSANSGRLAIASVHMSPVRVRDVHSSVWCGDLSGQLEIELEFHPAKNGSQPPSKIDMNAILRGHTVSAVSPIPQLPSDVLWSGPVVDRYRAPSIILTPQAAGGIIWARNAEGEVPSYYGSCPAYQSSTVSSHQQKVCLKPFYKARIMASLGAATNFSLVPTFHSCLISRTYEIDLRLSSRNFGIGFGPTVRLKIPVQVVYDRPAVRRDSVVSSAIDSCLGSTRMSMREELASDGYRMLPPDYESSCK